MNKTDFSHLPQIGKLLEDQRLKKWFPLITRQLTAGIASGILQKIRLTENTSVPDRDAIIKEIERKCRNTSRKRIIKLINATGIILHTNMGRTPIPSDVWNTVSDINTGYSNLELDLHAGKRGMRNGLIPELLSILTGAEASLIVNNNAAAVFLILSAFAKGREVIVSRGEQVQIGGGFRIPEILSLSGAKLVEVGTTNITKLSDYKHAITENTAMVLMVHRSNFSIQGFTENPSVSDITSVIPEHIILAVDQGSGNTTEDIPGEKKAGLYIKSGADIVCFSGDKLFGGPQAGIITGKKNLIEQLSANQLMRVFRPGKTIFSLMEEYLIRKINGNLTGHAETILNLPVKELKKRGNRILRGLDRRYAKLTDSFISTGGGSAPGETFPSVSLAILLPAKPERILARLRNLETPIIGTISKDRVLLNLATINPGELSYVGVSLKQIMEEYSD
ncbi:MAG: L-seryl-tRNA(Sec) selenium transferase [Spirochaetes bacterium]|nr:L-seryl-tRNA(Sec) selenium transferase [Spirochaetota bacterium]